MSLLTYTRYVELTGDSTSPSASVSAAIGDAERTVADFLRRPLELAEYTDTLHVDTDGRVYPKATPITEVPDGSGLTVLTDRSLGYATGSPGFITEWTSRTPTGYLTDQPTRSVTYTGGWTAATAPFSVLRAIARIGYRIANPRPMGDDVAGAQSKSVADASVSFGSGAAPGDAPGRSELEALAPGAEAALLDWRWSEDYA